MDPVYMLAVVHKVLLDVIIGDKEVLWLQNVCNKT